MIGTAHMARVTGLARSRFTSDAVRTPPEADPPPTVHPQCGFFATIAGIARKNHSGKNHGHQKPAMTIAKLNRSPVRTSPTQIARSTTVLIARVSIIPRALMRAESSAVRFGTSAANTSGKSSITGTKLSMNKRQSGMMGSDMMGLRELGFETACRAF